MHVCRGYMHKEWHCASSVKVGYFEWIIMYGPLCTGVMGNKSCQTNINQVMIPW